MKIDFTVLGRLTSLEEGGMKHIFPVQVYWEDTDAGGIVYYANYLKFIERARTDLLRTLSINQQQMMTEDELNFVVRDCHIEYLVPAKMDDVLEVHTTLNELKGASMRMQQIVLRDGEILNKSMVRVACLKKNGTPARFSPQIKDKFAPLMDVSGAKKK